MFEVDADACVFRTPWAVVVSSWDAETVVGASRAFFRDGRLMLATFAPSDEAALDLLDLRCATAGPPFATVPS